MIAELEFHVVGNAKSPTLLWQGIDANGQILVAGRRAQVGGVALADRNRRAASLLRRKEAYARFHVTHAHHRYLNLPLFPVSGQRGCGRAQVMG